MIEFEHTIFILLLLTGVLNAKPPRQRWATLIILIGVLLSAGFHTTCPDDKSSLEFSFRVSDTITPVAKYPQNSQCGLAWVEKCYPLGDYCAGFWFCPLVWWCFEMAWSFTLWRDCCQYDLESRRTREWGKLHESGGAAHFDFFAN